MSEPAGAPGQHFYSMVGLTLREDKGRDAAIALGDVGEGVREEGGEEGGKEA